MIAGIQSHIEGWTDPAELKFLVERGFKLARISAMTCTPEVMLECVRDAKAAGLNVMVTLAHSDRMRLLKPLLTDGDLVECRNEDDGDISPASYRAILDDFCRVGLELGIPIGGPTCSNTNLKCVTWATAIRGDGWPAGMTYLTWHSYDPHENTLFAEVEALSDGLPIIFSEFGYPSVDGVTEEDQAERLVSLWPVYAKYHAACLFQIHDGPDRNAREHNYGIRSHDGRWKPAAFTAPASSVDPQPADDPTPDPEPEPVPPPKPKTLAMYGWFMLRRSERIEVQPGVYTSPFPDSKTGEVLSLNPPKGRFESRPAGTAGPYEAWREEGERAVFYLKPGYTFGLPLVD